MDEQLHKSRLMAWMRYRARILAPFALLSLTFQVFVTFGHVHVASSTGTPSAATLSLRINMQNAALVATAASQSTDSASFPHAPPDGDAICPLCLLGSLIGSAVTASAPALISPTAYSDLEALAAVAFGVVGAAGDFFWSRGPPVS